MFFTFETAYDMARLSKTQAQAPLTPLRTACPRCSSRWRPIRSQECSRGYPEERARCDSGQQPDLFGSFKTQVQGQRTGMLAILGVVLILSVAIIGLIFSMAVNERRREIGVLRALGATRGAVLRSLLSPELQSSR